MSDVVIRAEQLSKQYRLGTVGRKTLHDDINRWLYRLVGKEDPYLKIGEENDRTVRGSSDYVWALRDVSFDVRQGEVLGVVGRNGAGKSTLLKILSRVTAPTTGQVKIKGRIASLLEVGTGFHPELTGMDNIFLNGAILGMNRREIKSKLEAIIDFAGVERYIDTPVKRYSSGMYVRLAFAVAAHLEPDILIVDEVLAVGDAEFQKKCLGKMKDVSEKDGRTVLFVSHNLPTILKLCNKAMVMDNGRTILIDTPESAIDVYLKQKMGNNQLLPGQRTDRKGDGMITCTNVELLNRLLQPSELVRSGDTLRIRISYEKHTDQALDIAFRIQVVDVHEQIFFTCNNAHSTEMLHVDQEAGQVVCTIDRLPLFGGSYFINIQIYSIGQGAQVHDEIEFTRELTVVDGDFFGTGKLPGVRKGVLIAHNWDLHGSK